MNQPPAVEIIRREVEHRAEAVYSAYIGGNLLEIYFADLIVPVSAEAEVERRQNATSELLVLFRHAPNNERLDLLYQYLLRWRIRSEAAHSLVNDLTSSLVNSQILPLRVISEALLTSPDMKIQNEKIWRQTFEFLDKSVSKLDYKGVRDVLKYLFELIAYCPVHFKSDDRPLHKIIEDLIVRICDRSNNLLPAYFVINEIRKLYCEPKCFPHWRIATCFTNINESFRPLAQIVSVTGRAYMLPVAGTFGLHLNGSWKLELATLKFFSLRGILPFSSEISNPQTYLIHQIILQPSFRELLNVFLALNAYTKAQQPPRYSLEEIFVSTILELMAEVERDNRQYRPTWCTLGAVLVQLVQIGSIHFPKLIVNLKSKLSILPYRKARDDLMWFLLHGVSPVVNKSNSFEDNFLILDLYRVLYMGSEEFSVSESDTSCVFMMAATCVWVMVLERVKEASTDPNFPRQQLKNIDLNIPPSINTQIKFLQETKNKGQLSLDSYMFATFCNAYSAVKETFNAELVPLIFQYLETGRNNNAHNVQPVTMPGGLLADGKCVPLKLEFLDSITVHVRIHIIQKLLESFYSFIQQKTQFNISPALLETYSRLLSYLDIETFGLHKALARLIHDVLRAATAEKQLMQQQGAMMTTPRNGAMEVAHILCEILSYRLIQMPAGYRVQIFNSRYQFAGYFGSNVQFFWMLESTIVRLILWFPLHDIVQHAIVKALSQVKEGTRPMFYDSEELTKLMVLSIAKACALSGSEGMLDDSYRTLILQMAPHYWPTSTLNFFPPQLVTLYTGTNMAVNPASTTLASRQYLRTAVEQDYVKVWRTSGNDPQLVEHFTRTQSQRIFLCIIWRHIFENGDIPPIAYRILLDLGPKNLLSQLSNLIDYILIDITGRNLSQCVDCLSKMVWKYAVVPLDWLVLTAVLRPYDSSEAFYSILVAFFLLQNDEFTNRVQECCSTMSPEFWRFGAEGYEKHVNYHQKFPEKYWPNIISEQFHLPVNNVVLPVYFGNVCFEVLPILDLLLQRIVELPEAEAHDKVFRKLLDSLGPLYKFHQQPITFLFNTLRFYEKRLLEKVETKQKLVFSIHNAVAPTRGDNWLLTTDCLKYLQSAQTAGCVNWLPDLDYFAHLVKRLVDALAPPWETPGWLRFDWRFCEFASPQTYALHAVCVELMTLPCTPNNVGASLLDVFIQCHPLMIRKDVHKWLNALGLIFSCLSTNYSETLYERIAVVMLNQELEYLSSHVFSMLNFEHEWALMEDTLALRLMALAHSVWLQAPIGYLNVLAQKVRDRYKPIVKTEVQFIFLCHLIVPFFQRLHQERTKMAMDVATDLYEMLLNVDKNTPNDLRYEDTICDVLYHMKYMFVGDGIRADTDRIIPQLKPSLQNKLRFISHQQHDTAGSTGVGSSGPVSLNSQHAAQ